MQPLLYKVFGLWGNYEGSGLLFTWILSIYAVLLEIFVRRKDVKKIALSVQNLIISGFSLFSILLANPFLRIFTLDSNGMGLNPILQDLGLTIHPPILFFGYVGFSAVFSLTLAATMLRERPREWAKLIRPWVLSSWMFLTLGISLGSWWAYRELGWGGFWAWDPVENVSLIPWLLGVALIHMISLVQKYEIYSAIAILVSKSVFIFSLCGTFLVRSGLLISVHAFASDPEKGLFLLLLIGMISIAGLLVFIIFHRDTKEACNFGYASKITAIVINNVLMLTAFAVVFIGTIYPIVLELITGDVISVGSPYYNTIFSALVVALLLMMVIVSRLSWNGIEKSRLHWKLLLFIVLLSILLIVFYGTFTIIVLLSALLFFAIVEEYCKKIRLFMVPISSSIKMASALPFRYYAMLVAHMGMAVLIFGVICSYVMQKGAERYMKEHESLNISDLKVTLLNVSMVRKPHYEAVRGTFVIEKQGKVIAELYPESRFYLAEAVRNSESSIYHGFVSDLYIVTGDIDPKMGIAVKVYYKPGISFVWLGFAMMVLGGALGVCGSVCVRSEDIYGDSLQARSRGT